MENPGDRISGKGPCCPTSGCRSQGGGGGCVAENTAPGSVGISTAPAVCQQSRDTASRESAGPSPSQHTFQTPSFSPLPQFTLCSKRTNQRENTQYYFSGHCHSSRIMNVPTTEETSSPKDSTEQEVTTLLWL